MKKILSLSFLSIIFLALAACHVETSTSYGLKVEKTALAKETANNKLIPVKNATFKRGDIIYYILLNVSGFKKGDDGMNFFDVDMQVTDPDGKILISKQRLLGEAGYVALANNIAKSPHGIFHSSTKLKPGQYKIKLTIYDKIGNGSASKSTTLTLE